MARDFSRDPLPYTGDHTRYSIGSAPPWRRRLMSKPAVVAVIALLGVVLFSRGITVTTMSLWFVMSVVWLLGYYFECRQGQPPTATERVAALVWRVFRTFLCVGFGVAIVVGSVLGTIRGFWPLHSLADFLILSSWNLVALLCIWWGLVGNQWGSFLSSDLELYREKKRRYGWRF